MCLHLGIARHQTAISCLPLQKHHLKLSDAMMERIVSARDGNGVTVLMAAAAEGDAGLAQQLLSWEPQKQVTAVDNMGKNALMHAIKKGSPKSVSVLLMHSPLEQVAQQDSGGRNALMWAVVDGKADIVKLLLMHNPHHQVAAVDEASLSALMWACSKGEAVCAEMLLLHNAQQQIAACEGAGWNALMFAAGNGRSQCVKLLLAHNPQQQVAVRTQGRVQTALSVAALRGHKDTVRMLIAAGADVCTVEDRTAATLINEVVREAVQLEAVPHQLREAVVSFVSLQRSPARASMCMQAPFEGQGAGRGQQLSHE